MKRKRKKKYYDRHHIIPQSRNHSLANDPHNIVKVDACRHNLYHCLFYNLTPSEIIAQLVKEFWKNNWYWVQKAYNNREA